MIKHIIFTLHWIGMFVGPFCWVYFPSAWLVYTLVVLSWKLNRNRCLITQIEYALFGETFLGNNKFKVPPIFRYNLYVNTLACVLFNVMVI